MDAALKEAKKALQEDEVPIGAVIVNEHRIIGRGHNQVEQANDPTAHAEILAIRQAAIAAGDWRLSNCRLYVTVEPCLMCLGAILSARGSEIIYAVREPKTGAIRSKVGVSGMWTGRNLFITEGIRKPEALFYMQQFFAQLRNNKLQNINNGERYRSQAVTGSTRNRLAL